MKSVFTTGALLITLSCFATALVPGDDGSIAPQPPRVLDLDQVQLEIVDTAFVSRLSATNAEFKETAPDRYRGMVMTVCIKKPAGHELELNAPDLVLHYRYGDSADVANCHGLSGYSTVRDTDRPMKLLKTGYGKTVTGTATTKADTVYCDLFFMNLEPDTTDLHLLVAQPVGVSHLSQGWQQ